MSLLMHCGECGQASGRHCCESRAEGRVIDCLRAAIDPETGADIVRMRLVENLEADNEGLVPTRDDVWQALDVGGESSETRTMKLEKE